MIERRKRKYSGSDVPDNDKEMLARLYIAMKRRGISRKNYLDGLHESGVDVSSRTIDRWVYHVQNEIEVISTSKESGKNSLLDRDQLDVASGFVLSENIRGASVHVQDYQRFVKDIFQVGLSDSTVRNYLKGDGFSYRTLNNKGKSFCINSEALSKELWNWIQEQDFTTIRKIRQRLASIDFTFTSHRTEKFSGYAVEGGSQPMTNTSIPIYTNCIVTCLWSDGINRTPSMLFTFNPAFRRDRNPTARRSAQIEHLDQCLNNYEIDNDRIVYIGKPSGEKSVYACECPGLLKKFFQNYDVPRFTTILSDNGNSFFENGTSVLEALGFKQHITYPSSVHQFLSPNDNKLHGTAKQAWRKAGLDYTDDVKSSLYLLHQLDEDSMAHGRQWFDQNMLELKEENVDKLIHSTPNSFSNLHRQWIKSYRLHTHQDLRGDVAVLPENLNNSLDGDYWN